MREIRTTGSEGGGTGNSTGPSYPYQNSAFWMSWFLGHDGLIVFNLLTMKISGHTQVCPYSS